MTFGTPSFVLGIIFLTVVAPIWIVFHYITQWKRAKTQKLDDGQVVVEAAQLDALHDQARRLGERIDALEHILDEESPNWRHKNGL